jgi:hypothetical protein
MARSKYSVRYRGGRKIVTIRQGFRRRYRRFTGSRKMKIFGIPVSLILLCVGGYFVYSKYLKKPSAPAAV